MIEKEICLTEDLETWPISACGWVMTDKPISAMIYQEWTEEQIKESLEKVHKEREKISNSYPEYINLSWGE